MVYSEVSSNFAMILIVIIRRYIMLQLKRSQEITQTEAMMVANRMRGVRRLAELQLLAEELSNYTTEQQFIDWCNVNGNQYAFDCLKAIETFYLDGVHPSLNAIDVSIAVLKDFRGYAAEKLVKQEIA